jgi:hypothetical protein
MKMASQRAAAVICFTVLEGNKLIFGKENE